MANIPDSWACQGLTTFAGWYLCLLGLCSIYGYIHLCRAFALFFLPFSSKNVPLFFVCEMFILKHSHSQGYIQICPAFSADKESYLSLTQLSALRLFLHSSSFQTLWFSSCMTHLRQQLNVNKYYYSHHHNHIHVMTTTSSQLVILSFTLGGSKSFTGMTRQIL